MLPKTQKLSRKDFAKLEEITFKKATFPYGVVVFLNSEIQKSAIVISKKYVKHAPERNLAKRLFFEHIRKSKEHKVIFIKKKIDMLKWREELDKIKL